MRKRLLAFSMILLLPLPAVAATFLPAAIVPAQMAGESLVYDIAFLWFDRLAEGRFSFAAGARPGIWRAELEAKTLGVAGWLTGERVQRYVSIMEEGADGRLQSLYHESLILTGTGRQQREKGKRYLFDYQNGEMRYEQLRGGKVVKEEFLPFDKAVPPKDVLTAFVGFRAGQAGPLLPGQRYLIPTYSHKGVADIVVETIADAERGKYPFPPYGLLVRVRVAPEVFETGEGRVYIWFDENGRPAEGIVENVIGMGNVRGKLRQGP